MNKILLLFFVACSLRFYANDAEKYSQDRVQSSSSSRQSSNRSMLQDAASTKNNNLKNITSEKIRQKNSLSRFLCCCYKAKIHAIA